GRAVLRCSRFLRAVRANQLLFTGHGCRTDQRVRNEPALATSERESSTALSGVVSVQERRGRRTSRRHDAR
ncbi:MAG TPA: hypothetical protein VKA54_09775, partial [Gemmatimonadaceae bacterium]|nr:hypothetical protein [Gemmatimonadaceae bacterium]